MNSVKFFLGLASVFGALAVAVGAFGAHALKGYLKETGNAETFETAVKYQFYHTFALLAVGILLHLFHHKLFTYAGYCFTGGIVIFSGSLFVLCATNVKTWGAVTPVGGLMMIGGWVCLLLGVIQSVR